MVEKKVEKKEEVAKVRKNLRYEREKHREKVKGIFRFHEVPGGSMSFMYKEYKEDPLERYDLIDGQVYSLPLGVAKHLNKNCWYPVHAFAQDEQGKPLAKVRKKVQRCSFQSLEFVDIEDLTAADDIVTVQSL